MTDDQRVDLSPYLPRLALEWLMERPETTFQELEGTVVFVDISGFTKLSEKLAKHGKVGAEELTETIGGCFTELLAVAYAGGGSLIKFGGDALLLFFTGQDHAVRASRAAVGMRATLRRIGTLETTGGRVRLRMSVGVHSGLFNFFLVGSRHKELLVTGPAATQTVLMEQAAEAGEIVVSSSTASALPARFVGAAKGTGHLLRGSPGTERRTGNREPRRYDVDPTPALPMEIREHLLGGATEPEHRLVTVAFIRFEGSDEIVAAEGPAGLAERLAGLVEIVQRSAEEHGVAFLATDIDREGGKLILAAGAPRATGADEEATLLAVRSVIEAGPPLPVKIGVNNGHVFAGDIGPPYRRTYTVMGDTVNLAARLMAAAEHGQILAPASVLERSRTQFSMQALPPFNVKGKAKPVHAFVVGAATGGSDSTSASRLPLIGRDVELAELLGAMDVARTGRGRVVELVGETGMGGSRIANEVRDRASDAVVLWTMGGPYAASSPYFPFRMLLRDMLGVSKDEPPDSAADILRHRVDVDAPDLIPWLPLIGIVMDVPVEKSAATEALGDEFRRRQLERVTADFMSVVLAGPTMLVFEDIHYFDEASLGLLARLAELAPERPWLMLATRREVGAMESHRSLPNARTIALGPLTPEDSRLLAEALTEDAPIPAHEIDAIAERSGGNPLVLRELLASARTAGTAEELPDSIEALMTARIDQLPPRDRTLLRNASVLGTMVDETLFDAVLEGNLPERDDPVWRRLADYLAPDRGGYRFANPLIRDAAYEGLTFRARKALHARVGETLLGSEASLESQAEQLALHFFHAGRYFETWRFARMAGERAAEKYANVEAARFFERALEAGRRLQGVAPEDIVAVHEKLGDAWNLAGEYHRAEGVYRSARRVAQGDEISDARLLQKEAQIAVRLGRMPLALRRLSKGRSLIEGVESDEALAQRAQLSMWYATVRQVQGHHHDAIRWCNRTIEEARRSGDRKALAYANQILDWALDLIGQAGDHEHLKTALEIYEEIGDLKGQGLALNNLGGTEYFAGRWDDAVDLYERGRLAHEMIGDPVGAGLGIVNIGEILSDQGRIEEAEPLLRRALRISKAAGERHGVAYALCQLGRLAGREKRFEEAMASFEEARIEFADVGDKVSVFETETRMAECLALAGEGKDALELVEELVARARTREDLSGLEPVLIRTRGYALALNGDTESARIAFDESLEAARARGVDYEVALTLRAVAWLGGEPSDAARAESDEIFSRLGVVRIAEPPVRA